jgi:hypothetical protein
VTLSITAGTGDREAVLSGTTAVTAAAGVATFSNLSIDNAATGYILSAASTGLAGTTSAPFDITSADAPAAPAVANAPAAPTPPIAAPVPPPASTELVFTVQPSAAAEEATIRPAVQVTARQSSGRTATGFTQR